MTSRRVIPYADSAPETFSVPALCVELGYEVVGSDDAHAFVTQCGHAVRDAWIARHGVRPRTELTRKSNGKGKHHKARYPWTFRSTAIAVIRRVAEDADAAERAQLSLF